MADVFGVNNPGFDISPLTDAELLVVQQIGGLGDPNADRILFWDDSANSYAYLSPGAGLSIVGTTISASGATLADGDYGDITASSSGTVLTVDNGVISLAKMANVATATVFYRKTAGTGAPEVQTLATLKTDLGLTGTNSGDQTSVTGNAGTATALQTSRTIGTLTGDITSAGSGFDGTANNTNATTLATVNANVGSFTYASITVNAKGLITAASSGSAGGTGDVVGPASSTDNAIARYDLATGKLLQNSVVLIADTTGVISGTQGLTLSGTTSGTLAIKSAATAGTNTLTFPAGTTDFSATGGTGQFLKQASAGAAFTVSTVPVSEIAGFGTGVATALAVNTGSAGAFVLFNGALGTPSSGTVTNLTGTASININGTVGATTPASAVVTTLTSQTHLPATDGTYDLGSTTLAWNNLHLDTGATINIENGNWLATHTSAVLTITTGDIRMATAGTATTSVTTNDGSQTLNNKRINPRTSTTASSSTPTPNGDTDDVYTVTALAAGATFGAPTGTPVNGQKLIIRVKDNATPRTLAFNAIYRASSDLALPTTTITSKTIYMGFIYNSTDSKWDLIALLNNF